MNYCIDCGSDQIKFLVPEGDVHRRHVCQACGKIHYINPVIVAGAVTLYEGQFLLCRRAIEPRVGYWTYPAGFLEVGETVEQGAMREAYEEAEAKIVIQHLVGVYNLLAASQVHMIYAANMFEPSFASTYESSEVKLFTLDNLPWQELAFPVIYWALQAYIKSPHGGVVEQRDTSLSLAESLSHDIP